MAHAEHRALRQTASRLRLWIAIQDNRGPPVKHPVRRHRSHSVRVARFRKRTENYLCGKDHNPPTAHNKSGCLCEWRANDPCKEIGPGAAWACVNHGMISGTSGLNSPLLMSL